MTAESTPPSLPRVLPYYPHTIAGGTDPQPLASMIDPNKPSIDLAALADLFKQTQAPSLYLDRVLTDADHDLLLSTYGLYAQLDVVRGVDAVRKATDEEMAGVA